MSRPLTRISLALVFMLSSEVFAIGLGDINLDSALNEPLRAEIDLLSATPEELANLTVALASSETFARYGIDRPFYLQDVEFKIVATGPNEAVIQVRSGSPMSEPFLTFLVEANWPSGRLLREYTVLLDPPTYAPPAVQETPVVEAPRRVAPTDSARIERQPPVAESAATPPPEEQPMISPPPARGRSQGAAPDADEAGYATTSAGDYYVERGDTLWGIASRMRPDGRLTMNQTMLAIFEANPGAFAGNINRLSAGTSLRIPSADEVFQISRDDAFSEVKRQNESWDPGSTVSTPDTSYADTSYTDPPADSDYTSDPDATETRPSLTLVPPDEEPAGITYDDDLSTTEPISRETEIENRIAELEAADVPDQQSLIEVRDNELANLRQELANIRGEVYEPPADATFVDEVVDDADDVMGDIIGDESVDDEIMADTDDVAVDDTAAGDDDAADAEPAPPVDQIRTTRASEPSIVDQILEFLTSTWAMIGGALVVVAGLLFWFVRRGGDDEGDMKPWETLDDGDLASGTMTATEALSAPTHDDEAIVVVEQESGIGATEPETIEAPAPDLGAATSDTGEFGSLEDTFSSETAVNLDQTDPIAEADFHMAYGLYDQAADLINGALETDPNDTALMSKLCEIYFVWGNQDAFIDSATRLKAAVGDGDSAQWDKIVIMGQQIAADHALFAGAAVAGATKAVDLSFEAEMDEAGALDMDFGGDAEAESEIIDLGAGDDTDGGVDFLFDEATADAPEVDMSLDVTAEMPSASETTVESPTIEQQFAATDSTSELPSLDESLEDAIADSGLDSDATAEIDLDDLDLDITGSNEVLEDTGVNEALAEVDEVTGNNPELDISDTSFGDDMGFDDLGATGTGMRLAPDETGRMPSLDAETETSVDLEMLDATGHTQVLSDDLAVETGVDLDVDFGEEGATVVGSDFGDEDTAATAEAETMLASLDSDDEDEFDFATTEALPAEAFTGDPNLDETGEMPAVAGTDVDLDLDDLTAALQVSDVGDTIEQPRDDATVEQPRPSLGDETAEIPTMEISPDDMSDDLHEARTMTEVGTKLDLARAYVDMGDPAGARSILEEVLDEGDEGQRQQAQQLLDSLPS